MNSLSLWQGLLLGTQMLFTAFGALVLVPLLTGLNPSVALFAAGVGTLIFQWVTKRQVPVFLGSSFAFIPAIIYGTKQWGVSATLGGLTASGLLYLLFSVVLKFKGKQILVRVLPPIVTGPIIMLIGLILAPVAVNMAMGKTGDGATVLLPQSKAILLALIPLLVTSGLTLFGKGLFRLSSILWGLILGYLVSLAMGVVDFSFLKNSAWLALPDFTPASFSWEAIFYIVPVAIAPAIEHFGDILAIGQVTKKDYTVEPGIHRTMLGDGLATILSSLIGGPPNTTYSEVTGAVALTKNENPKIMTYAACLAIIFSFVGKLAGLLQTIPTPVIGGLLVLLFGNIIVIGLDLLVRSKLELTAPRNMIIIGVVLTCGVGGLSFSAGNFALQGVGLASLIGVFLNLLLPEDLNHS